MQRNSILGALAGLTLAACGTASPTAVARSPRATTASPSWQQISSPRIPSPRDSALMAYDADSRSVILAGGKSSCTGGPNDLQDTWSWNGTAWIELHPAAAFPPRLGSGNPVAYDPATASVISLAFPGCGLSTSTVRWSGSGWSLQENQFPAPANTGGMAYDPVNRAVILWSPQTAVTDAGLSSSAAATTWAFAAGVWTELKPAQEPPASLAPAVVAYDSSSSQLILYSEVTQQTWAWSGNTWRRLAQTASPPPRTGASAAYDAALGEVVLFGGAQAAASGTAPPSPTSLADMWCWNGTSWHHLLPTTTPPARYDAQMAYDTSTRQLLLFGGATGTGRDLSDTWVFQPSS